MEKETRPGGSKTGKESDELKPKIKQKIKEKGSKRTLDRKGNIRQKEKKMIDG
jgi:hypothetical protein